MDERPRASGWPRRPSSAAPRAWTTPPAATSRFVKSTFPRGLRLDGLQDRRRLRQWRRLQGRARRCCGSWAPRSSRSASRPTASTSTRSAAPPHPRRCSARSSRTRRRYRHRARRRRRPAGDLRRTGPRSSTATRSWPSSPRPGRAAGQLTRRRRGGDGDVQSRPRALPGSRAGSGWRAPRSATAMSLERDARRRLQPRRRAVGPHHPLATSPPPATA